MTDRGSGTTDQRALAALARDAALARIGRVRVMMLIAAVGLTALLAIVASALLPGKSFGASHKTAPTRATSARRTPSTPAGSTVEPRMPAPAGPAALGLQAPNQAPGAGAATPAAPSPQPAPAPAPAQPVQPAPAPVAPSGGAVVSGGS